MNDPLEDFIRQNRGGFDDKIPRLEVWAAIDDQLGNAKSKRKILPIWKFARMAAAVVLLLTTGGFIGNYVSNVSHNSMAALSDVSPEMAELEQFYKGELNKMHTKLVSFKNFDPSINDDLKQLELLMEDLRKELQKHPDKNNEDIINAMIQNYRTRVEILERVMTRLQSMDLNTVKTDENERSINL